MHEFNYEVYFMTLKTINLISMAILKYLVQKQELNAQKFMKLK